MRRNQEEGAASGRILEVEVEPHQLRLERREGMVVAWSETVVVVVVIYVGCQEEAEEEQQTGVLEGG